MSMEYILFATLDFDSAAAIEAARKELEEEGYSDSDDNVLTSEELKWAGHRRAKPGARPAGNLANPPDG